MLDSLLSGEYKRHRDAVSVAPGTAEALADQVDNAHPVYGFYSKIGAFTTITGAYGRIQDPIGARQSLVDFIKARDNPVIDIGPEAITVPGADGPDLQCQVEEVAIGMSDPKPSDYSLAESCAWADSTTVADVRQTPIHNPDRNPGDMDLHAFAATVMKIRKEIRGS